jgi:carbonic anhydrase/acetyltransferase-like protein (isoleucine patch superfamily)
VTSRATVSSEPKIGLGSYARCSSSPQTKGANVPIYEFEGHRPNVHPDAFIAPNATLVGDVTIEAGASVWYGAVIRADVSPVIVREDANIQDGAVIHGPPGITTEIGRRVTIGHLCQIHGATIEDDCLIGNGATVLDGAVIGAGTLIAAHSLVAAGAKMPPGVMAAGVPAVVKKEIAGTPAGDAPRNNGVFYAELARRHRASLDGV